MVEAREARDEGEGFKSPIRVLCSTIRNKPLSLDIGILSETNQEESHFGYDENVFVVDRFCLSSGYG